MEVCELHENSGGGCYISNDALARKLGVSLATITRTVALLTAGELLTTRVEKQQGNRRYLTPAARVRACYCGGSEAEQFACTAELTIVKNELTIVKNEVDYSQKCIPYKDTTKDEQLILEHPNVALMPPASAGPTAVGELEERVSKLESRLAKATEVYHAGQDAYRQQQAELAAARQQQAELAAENEKLRAALARRQKRATPPARRPIPALPEWYPEQMATFSSTQQELLGRFHGWAQEEHLETVFGMDRPLTPADVLRLTEKHGVGAFKAILMEMEASKALAGKTSAYHSADNWIRGNERREQQREERYQQQQNTTREQRPAYGGQGRYAGSIN